MNELEKIKTQIPLYRAKEMDSNEYVIGFYVENMNYKPNIQVNNIYFEEIDPTTLAIHFTDMLDSQGNKIFASLSEDGKGGDMFITENSNELYDLWGREDYGRTTAIFNSKFGLDFTHWKIEFESESVFDVKHTKIIGIQQ